MCFYPRRLRHLVLSAPLVASTMLPAADCSNALFQGRYGFQILGYDLTDAAGNPGVFPAGSTGVLIADGNGRVTSATDTINENGIVQERDFIEGGIKVTTPAGEQFIPTPPADFTYAVQTDCRGLAKIAIQGQTLFEFPFVVVDGGREILLNQKAPLPQIGIGRLVRTEDNAAEQLALVKRLLDRIALRVGINP